MKIANFVKVVLAGLGVLLLIGLSADTLVSAPAYAVVFVDDATKTVIAPQCVKEWQRRPTKTFDLLRRTTMGEAERLNYELDYECKETGVFSQDGPSLAGLLFIKLGLSRAPRYWWDMPGIMAQTPQEI